ncbi:MAG: hypothetical protein FJ088_13370, partial [Deltaproteobacteria bacterium]|nr:hypothetical protein [Deltaproteobacteria bacterium]
MNLKKITSVPRNLVVFGLVFAGFIGAVVQAYFYQIESVDFLRNKVWGKVRSDHVYTKRRGNIYDRTGQRLFASSVSVKSVVYRGAPLNEKRKEIAYSLAEALNLPLRDALLKVLPYTNFEYIKRDISAEEENVIAKLNLSGVSVEKERRRFNPAGGLLIQALGTVNIDSKGMSGIEKFYNEYLLQGDYKVNYLRDSKKRKIFTGGLPDSSELTGYDVVLTVDMEIQNIVEEELEKAISEHGAKSAVAVVLDPHTFEILAMANTPVFQPEEMEKYCGKKPVLVDGLNLCKNRAVYDRFEQGSIEKVFTVAAALETGSASEKTTVFAGEGKCRIGKYLIEDVKPLGWVTPREIIKYSSNCGAIEIAARTGSAGLYRILKDFGFGGKTGVDLPDEVGGYIEP